MNIAILKGNITRDPELKFTSAGNAICTFGIAVNERWKDKDGNLKEDVTFLDCQCWGKTGEVIAERLRKGDPILIHGKIRQEEWDDKKTGEKKRATRIRVESFEFCGGKRGDDTPAPQKRAQAPAKAPQSPVLPTEGEDDVPF